jgi:uncharacterized protein YbaR (Trm112 family)
LRRARQHLVYRRELLGTRQPFAEIAYACAAGIPNLLVDEERLVA